MTDPVRFPEPTQRQLIEHVVRWRLKDRGVTIQEVALELGVSAGSMHRYLRGDQPMDPDTLLRFVANYLRMPLEWVTVPAPAPTDAEE